MWPQVAGTSHDMFAVDKERAAATSNCYISTLHILSIDQHHARDYVLRLENEHGEEVRTNDANISDVELWDVCCRCTAPTSRWERRSPSRR